MALAEDFEKTGNWLFRRRSYLPLILVAIATAVIIIQKKELVNFHNIYWNIACFTVSMFGLLIRALTIGYTPRGTSGRNTKEGQVAEQLNTKGVYSVVRHPLYLGNFFMWFGLILYVGTPWFVVFSVAFFWIYYERIMFAEEQFIRQKFDKEYLEWSLHTPAFVPDLRCWKSPELSFSLINVLKREYSGFFGNIVSFVYLNLVKNYFFDGNIWLDTKWQIGGMAGLVIYVTLKILKKRTHLLSAEGR